MSEPGSTFKLEIVSDDIEKILEKADIIGFVLLVDVFTEEGKDYTLSRAKSKLEASFTTLTDHGEGAGFESLDYKTVQVLKEMCIRLEDSKAKIENVIGKAEKKELKSKSTSNFIMFLVGFLVVNIIFSFVIKDLSPEMQIYLHLFSFIFIGCGILINQYHD